MPKFMTDHLSPAQIESEINQVHADIRRKASSLNARRGELTPQGFTAEWQRATAVERSRLQELTGVADGWATSARTAAQKIKTSVLPQPTDEQRDGAERTAARCALTASYFYFYLFLDPASMTLRKFKK